MYRQLVHEITQTFKKISDEIIDIENKLRSQHNLPEVAKFVAKVQEEEKLKLETVRYRLSCESNVASDFQVKKPPPPSLPLFQVI